MPGRDERARCLVELIERLARETDVELLARSAGESAAAAPYESLNAGTNLAQAVKKALSGPPDTLSEAELLVLEAIVMPVGRPVAFVRGNAYDSLAEPWSHLNDAMVRARLAPLFPAVGRVELPASTELPYAGTAFLVGQRLLMTNRHVARHFCKGSGIRHLIYRTGDAGIHFRRHHGEPPQDMRGYLEVERVEMIHPLWDMALLRVGPLAGIEPLKLSIEPPDNSVGSDVVVIGYPIRNSGIHVMIQDQVFEGVYGVKRIQPGKIRPPQVMAGYASLAPVLVHDSSTLGGNSGSAIVDVKTGVVRALHFAGVYLKANYGVPTVELARDARVVDAGVNFEGIVPPTDAYDRAWASADSARSHR